ncbi:hypothetical protein [Solirubrobacter soli]|uniref:hypothetical protein n=1 Tax=Solirubrobacter soli TaxID=363832 RepID=UPI0012FA8481|nr:hypothetical protein [Solirubrobacter soli]
MLDVLAPAALEEDGEVTRAGDGRDAPPLRLDDAVQELPGVRAVALRDEAVDAEEQARLVGGGARSAVGTGLCAAPRRAARGLLVAATREREGGDEKCCCVRRGCS